MPKRRRRHLRSSPPSRPPTLKPRSRRGRAVQTLLGLLTSQPGGKAARALDAVVEETLLGWPAVLATFVRAHLVRRRESHPEEALSPDHVLEALHLAVAEGGPELATQAEAELERTEPVKAGESVATFSEPTQVGDYLKV